MFASLKYVAFQSCRSPHEGLNAKEQCLLLRNSSGGVSVTKKTLYFCLKKKLCSDYDMKFLIGQKQAYSMLSYKNDEGGSQRSQNSYKGAEKIV